MSDDHHQALVLARCAMRAGDAGDECVTCATWEEVERSYDERLAPHFAIEEEFLLPALEAVGEAAFAERTRADHRRLHGLVHGEGRRSAKRLSEFGAALRDHVRFEERELFPLCEERLSGVVLAAVSAACAHTRTEGSGQDAPADQGRPREAAMNEEPLPHDHEA